MPTVARIAAILSPDADLDMGQRVERLLVRLTYGVPAAAVDLARGAGATLTRGDYCELVRHDLAAIQSIADAGDERLLGALGGDRQKAEIVREAARLAAVRASAAEPVRLPILDPYVG